MLENSAVASAEQYELRSHFAPGLKKGWGHGLREAHGLGQAMDLVRKNNRLKCNVRRPGQKPGPRLGTPYPAGIFTRYLSVKRAHVALYTNSNNQNTPTILASKQPHIKFRDSFVPEPNKNKIATYLLAHGARRAFLGTCQRGAEEIFNPMPIHTQNRNSGSR